MKKIVLLISLIFFAYGCNKENIGEESHSLILKEKKIDNNNSFNNPEVNNFLNQYYNDNYQIGESLKLSDENKKIFSIVRGGITYPIGYVVTELDSNDFLYFIDFDKVNNQLLVVDIKNKESEIIDNFYTNKSANINLINLIRNNDNHQINTFIGWHCGPAFHLPDGYYHTCCFYIFWLRTWHCKTERIAV